MLQASAQYNPRWVNPGTLVKIKIAGIYLGKL